MHEEDTRRQNVDSEERHNSYLNKLINCLMQVGERGQPRWIMKDGIWQRESGAKNKLCDLIINYYDDVFSLIELKGSKQKKYKAREQLDSAERFVRECFDAERIRRKVVYYTPYGYAWEFA